MLSPLDEFPRCASATAGQPPKSRLREELSLALIITWAETRTRASTLMQTNTNP